MATNDELRGIVSRMVAGGESEQNIAAVIQRYNSTRQTTPEPAEPSGLQRAAQTFLDYVPNPIGIAKGIRGAFRKATSPEAIPTIGAIGGGILGGIVGNVPGAIAGAGIGGGLGKGGEIMAREARGEAVPQTAGGVIGAMAKRGAGEAALQAAGGAIGKPLQAIGRGAYRFALRPQNKVLGKYGKDVIDEGLRRRAPVSAKGIEKVSGLKGRAIEAKDARLAEAGDRVSILTKPLVDDTTAKLGGQADELRRAGLGDPSDAWRDQGAEIVGNNARGLAPAELESIKRTHDNRLGGAFQKIRNREPLTPEEMFGVQFTGTAREAQEAITPGYKAANQEIMALSGLESALRNRVEGSAANDGLANLGLLFGGIQAAPAKVASMPAVASRLGIGAHGAGRAAEKGFAQAVRAAMLAALDGDDRR